jgi:L-fuculose-phosphate aldolase
MILEKEKQLKDEIIKVGKRLFYLRLIAGRAGNLSIRIDKDIILITVTGALLGELNYDDIVKVDLNNENDLKNPHLTTEFPLHQAIYKNFSHQAVIHCHPVLINAYFAVYPDIKALTFESKFYLGNVPVIEQDTPSITKPELVAEALKTNNLVVIKNHGVVSVGDSFKNALQIIEILEEAVKTAAVARLFKKEILDDLDKELKETFISKGIYRMFSKEHIQAIVDLVNKDEFILRKGKELDLTLKLAIKLDESNNIYKFNFEKGRITRLELSASGGDEDAPFVISAPKDVWELVFLGRLDPFVATMQGKMKLKGQLQQLSKWYVPFSRLFELFKQVRIG